MDQKRADIISLDITKLGNGANKLHSTKFSKRIIFTVIADCLPIKSSSWPLYSTG